jgi:hypothetical protein
MQLLRQGFAGALVLGAAATMAPAAVFTDATGENFDGNANMDISSVEVTNTATTITFKITLNGSIANPNDWGKYLIGIDTSNASGDAGAPVGNPWGRNITMADKMDAFVGSWADSGGGFQPWTFSGSWTQNGSGTPTFGSNTTTITTTLASLGLSLNQTIEFDVYSSGGNGGDSANDASANAAQSTTGWGGPYTTPTDSGHVYTIAIPEPASLGVLGGLASVAMLRRRRNA